MWFGGLPIASPISGRNVNHGLPNAAALLTRLESCMQGEWVSSVRFGVEVILLGVQRPSSVLPGPCVWAFPPWDRGPWRRTCEDVPGAVASISSGLMMFSHAWSLWRTVRSLCAFFFLCVGLIPYLFIEGESCGCNRSLRVIGPRSPDPTPKLKWIDGSGPFTPPARHRFAFHVQSARVVRRCTVVMHHPGKVARIELAKTPLAIGDHPLTTPFVLAMAMDVSCVPGNRVSCSMTYVLRSGRRFPGTSPAEPRSRSWSAPSTSCFLYQHGRLSPTVPKRRMLNGCEALVGFDVFLSPPSYRAFPFRFWALNIEYCTLIPLPLFDLGIPSSDGVG